MRHSSAHFFTKSTSLTPVTMNSSSPSSLIDTATVAAVQPRKRRKGEEGAEYFNYADDDDAEKEEEKDRTEVEVKGVTVAATATATKDQKMRHSSQRKSDAKETSITRRVQTDVSVSDTDSDAAASAGSFMSPSASNSHRGNPGLWKILGSDPISIVYQFVSHRRDLIRFGRTCKSLQNEFIDRPGRNTAWPRHSLSLDINSLTKMFIVSHLSTSLKHRISHLDLRGWHPSETELEWILNDLLAFTHLESLGIAITYQGAYHSMILSFLRERCQSVRSLICDLNHSFSGSDAFVSVISLLPRLENVTLSFRVHSNNYCWGIQTVLFLQEVNLQTCPHLRLLHVQLVLEDFNNQSSACLQAFVDRYQHIHEDERPTFTISHLRSSPR